jgi:hypothetical protein
VGSLLLLLLGSATAGACSSPIECTPPVPAGAVYQVTLKSETANSDKCHVVDGLMMSPFTLTVGKAQATDSNPSCTSSPAVSAPLQHDVKIVQCVPKESDMLGVYCTIQYPSTCDGHISFYFTAPPGGSVNWNDSVITNALFRVEDRATSCLPDIANCLDEYTAELKRVQ